MSQFIACLSILLFSACSWAQIIYQPVQYQHGAQSKYYYGGNDPRLKDHAEYLGTFDPYPGFHAPNATDRPARVYSDAVPYRDAGAYGKSIDDAYNEAYGNVPLYFRKADLFKSAAVEDGAIVVPAQACKPAGYISISAYRKGAAPAAPTIVPAKQPQPLLIIPKSLLKQKLWSSDNLAV